jgi:hypothetical protein
LPVFRVGYCREKEKFLMLEALKTAIKKLDLYTNELVRYKTLKRIHLLNTSQITNIHAELQTRVMEARCAPS